MLLHMLKGAARAVLPPNWWSALRAVRQRGHALRLAGGRRRFQQLNRGVGPEEIRVRPDLQWRIKPEARQGFEAYAWWWPEMARELDRFRDLAHSRSVLIDVGACHGLFSMAFVSGRRHARAVAVDPSAESCRIVREHAEANGLGIRVEQLALGSQEGTAFIPAGSMRLAEEGDQDSVARVTTLDALSANLRLEPDFVKIDVEGYELRVLQGSGRILREHRPALMIELHPDELDQFGGSVTAVVDLLEGHRYRIRDLAGRSLHGGRRSRRWGHIICLPA